MWKFDKEATDICEKSSEMSKPSSLNIHKTFKSRFFNSSQESTEVKETGGDSESEKKICLKRNPSEKKTINTTKDRKKPSFNANIKPMSQTAKCERDFRRFKTKYNNSMGNILRDWMSLIYCILTLRMNLIKLVLENFSKIEFKHNYLQNQILLESKIMYNMIKGAQFYSQKKIFNMWVELEKLISDRMTIKNAMKIIQMKEIGLRDWRSAAARLSQMQEELMKHQKKYEAIQLSKDEAECAVKENAAQLENACRLRELECKQLIDEIRELKKKEVQMRGKILLNMKSYKDLKTKRQNLLNMVNEMNQLKSNQNEMVKEYSAKIEMLKSKIEETEKQILMEREEKRKLKTSLENFANFM